MKADGGFNLCTIWYKINIGDLVIDRTSYTLKVGEQQIKPPEKEFDLLQNIWGSDKNVLSRTVDVHVWKVRKKSAKAIFLP